MIEEGPFSGVLFASDACTSDGAALHDTFAALPVFLDFEVLP